MTKYGIDVSEWQGVIDWEAVKASGKVDFVILRAGLGKVAAQVDKQFYRNYAECTRLGIPVGAYWYSYAKSEKEAKEEAQACLEVLKDKKFQYPVYYDIEEKTTLGTGKADDIIQTFCKTLEASGIFAGLYMSRSPLKSYVSLAVRNRFALWIAEYNSKCNYDGAYGMWQKSSEGSIPGISGRVDLDECYIDYPKAIVGSEKLQKYVTLIIDEHKYSGLLTEE